MKKTCLLGLILFATNVAALGVRPRAAVLQDSRRAAVYHRDGARFALEGRLSEAMAAFEQAVMLDPKNGDSFYSLGNVYAELGRWEDAVAAYRKSVQLNDKDLEAYNGLGIALSNRGVYVQAAAAFRRAISIYPKWAEPYYHLSRVYKEMGQEVAAQVAYTEAVRLRPDYAAQPPQTFKNAAKSAAKPQGERASTTLNAAPSGSPSLKHEEPSRVSEERRNGSLSASPPVAVPPRAEESAEKAARLNSDDARASYDLGAKHLRAGRYAEAIAPLRQAVILDRDDVEIHLALGDAYAGLERWSEAVDAYERASRLEPDNTRIYERLGRSYAKLRETAPAPGGASSARRGETVEKTESPNARATLMEGVDPTTIYLVGVGDMIDVRVLNARNPQATSHTITPAGLLDYPPLTEPLKVVGLTTDQIAARLASELKRRGIASAPEVTVGVREYVSHSIIVSGLVKDPGEKILRREGVPLHVIVAHAQPLSEAGSATVVSRLTGRTTTVDLSDARAANALLVRPGDVVTVKARETQYFYIAGAVRQPGRKEHHAQLTLTQAVLSAGGVSTTSASSVNIARQGPDGRLVTKSYDLRAISAGKTPDPFVQPGDRIEVLR